MRKIAALQDKTPSRNLAKNLLLGKGPHAPARRQHNNNSLKLDTILKKILHLNQP